MESEILKFIVEWMDYWDVQFSRDKNLSTDGELYYLFM